MKNITMPILAFVAIATSSWSKAIDMNDRYVPFTVGSDNILSTTLTKRFLPASSSMFAKAIIPQEQAGGVYGLLVSGEKPDSIRINDRSLDIDPLPRGDGFLYMVDSMYLKTGENLFVVNANSARSWSGTTFFSTKNDFEINHFAISFADRSYNPDPNTVSQMLRDITTTPNQDKYDVLHYDCTWKPNFSASSLLTGSQVNIGLKSLVSGLQTIELDFDTNGGAMVIESIDTGAGTATITPTFNTTTNIMFVTLPTALTLNQEIELRIKYRGTPRADFEKAIFGSKPYTQSTHNSFPVVYTASQPYGARRWFPCKDYPGDKANRSTQKIIVPTNLSQQITAISNGVLQSTVNNGDNTRTFTWVNNYPISTYLLSFAATNYEYYGGTYTARDGVTQMPVGHYIYPENYSSEGNGYLGTLDVMQFFANTFGEYPFLDQKYQTATWNITFGIEHQTNTSMPPGASAGVGNGYTRRNIHELAHQWYGNKVTAHNWDHAWLNEGFASYAEVLFDEYKGGKSGYHTAINNWQSSVTNITALVNPDADVFANSVIYRKGPWVLHMLRNVLGDEKFFAGMKGYLTHGYTTALSQPNSITPLDFQSVMETAAELPAGGLKRFFDQWLYGAPGATYEARPIYSFQSRLETATSGNKIHVGIRQLQAGNPYWMPIDIVLTDQGSNKMTVRALSDSTTNTVTVDIGGFVPVTASFDPDNWVHKVMRASIYTISLPAGSVGTPYSASLNGGSSSTPVTWSLGAGAPAWVSLSSNGTVSGMPTVQGKYNIPVRLTDNSGAVIDSTVVVTIANLDPVKNVVINEFRYEQRGGTEGAEFVELFNNESTAVDIGGWQLLLVGTNGTASETITVPTNTVIPAGGYYVFGNSSAINVNYPGVVNYSTSWTNSLTNNAPGGIVLKNNEGRYADSVSYRSDIPNGFGSGSERGNVLAQGGVGRLMSRAFDTGRDATYSRLPNGTKTGSNLLDFAAAPPTPGAANTNGFTMPFEDNFDTSIRSEWRPSWQDLRTKTAGATGAPATASPQGGAFLEVYDSTGGGDAVYLPGSYNRLNFEGYIWIPQDLANNAGWSTGVGIAIRSQNAWLGNVNGYDMDSGFYLEYENTVSGRTLKDGSVPLRSRAARLLVVDCTPTIATGSAAANITELGYVTGITPGAWQKFRMVFNREANVLHAEIGGQVIYTGTIPAGNYNTAGGVCVGFREEHSGNPSTANQEGTFVDGIKVNSATGILAGVEDYNLY